MNGDPWEQLWYTTTWMMNNLPPIEDYHYFEILRERQKQYQEDLEFYGENEIEYDEDLYFNNNYNNYNNYNYIDENFEENKFNDSSSESDYDDYEYI